MSSVAAKLQQVRTRIATACETSQRPVQSVTLLAVTKTFGPQAVRDAHAAGQHRLQIAHRAHGDAVEEAGQIAPSVAARATRRP